MGKFILTGKGIIREVIPCSGFPFPSRSFCLPWFFRLFNILDTMMNEVIMTCVEFIFVGVAILAMCLLCILAQP